MITFVSVLEFLLSFYFLYIGFNLINFKGRQKRLVQAVITDETKAMEYGKKSGLVYIITGILLMIFGIVYFVTKLRVLPLILDCIIIAVLIITIMLNKKYAGRTNVTMY